MLMAVRVTDYGGRWCDRRAVALSVGDCLRRLSPMKKRPPRRPFIPRMQTNILGENAEVNSLCVPYFLRGVARDVHNHKLRILPTRRHLNEPSGCGVRCGQSVEGGLHKYLIERAEPAYLGEICALDASPVPKVQPPRFARHEHFRLRP